MFRRAGLAVALSLPLSGNGLLATEAADAVTLLQRSLRDSDEGTWGQLWRRLRDPDDGAWKEFADFLDNAFLDPLSKHIPAEAHMEGITTPIATVYQAFTKIMSKVLMFPAGPTQACHLNDLHSIAETLVDDMSPWSQVVPLGDFVDYLASQNISLGYFKPKMAIPARGQGMPEDYMWEACTSPQVNWKIARLMNRTDITDEKQVRKLEPPPEVLHTVWKDCLQQAFAVSEPCADTITQCGKAVLTAPVYQETCAKTCAKSKNARTRFVIDMAMGNIEAHAPKEKHETNLDEAVMHNLFQIFAQSADCVDCFMPNAYHIANCVAGDALVTGMKDFDVSFISYLKRIKIKVEDDKPTAAPYHDHVKHSLSLH